MSRLLADVPPFLPQPPSALNFGVGRRRSTILTGKPTQGVPWFQGGASIIFQYVNYRRWYSYVSFKGIIKKDLYSKVLEKFSGRFVDIYTKEFSLNNSMKIMPFTDS